MNTEEFPSVDRFLETKALWLLLEEREDEVCTILEQMTRTELYEFERELHVLRALVNSAFWTKREE